VGLARAQLALGEPSEASTLLTDAIALFERYPLDPRHAAEARAELQRAQEPRARRAAAK
jgi:hypothetical protein